MAIKRAHYWENGRLIVFTLNITSLISSSKKSAPKPILSAIIQTNKKSPKKLSQATF